MASKTFALGVNDVVVLKIEVSGDDELVNAYAKTQLESTYGVLDKLRDTVVTVATNAINAKAKQLTEDK